MSSPSQKGQEHYTNLDYHAYSFFSGRRDKTLNDEQSRNEGSSQKCSTADDEKVQMEMFKNDIEKKNIELA